MRGNEARYPTFEEPMKENPIEPRISAIERDVSIIKDQVAKLSIGQAELKR